MSFEPRSRRLIHSAWGPTFGWFTLYTQEQAPPQKNQHGQYFFGENPVLPGCVSFFWRVHRVICHQSCLLNYYLRHHGGMLHSEGPVPMSRSWRLPWALSGVKAVSYDKIGTIRKISMALRKDDTHKSRTYHFFVCSSGYQRICRAVWRRKPSSCFLHDSVNQIEWMNMFQS